MLHYDKLSRRLFLKTASGYILALPLIPSLITKAANAAIADSMAYDEIPNYVFIRTLYGMYETQRYIHNVPGEAPEDKWVETLITNESETKLRSSILRTKDLSTFKKDGTNYSISDWLGTRLHELDLLDYATIPLGNSSYHACNHHNSAVFGAMGRDDNDIPLIKQSSIDVLIEEKLKSLKPSHKAVRVMPADRLSASSGSCSYKYNKITGKFEILPIITNVSDLFSEFFVAPDSSLENLQKAAMDNVNSEYRKLANFVSPEEKVILEKYADEIQEVSKLIGGEKVACATPTYSAPIPGQFGSHYRAANTLLAQVFNCGLSKMVCYELCHYHDTEKDASAFASSHHPKDGSSLNAGGDLFNREIILDLAVKLKNTANGSGGNLLDDSIMFHASEDNWNHVGDGGQAFLMMGKAKGKVNAGKIYDFRLRYSEDFNRNIDEDKLVYRINGGAKNFGAIGWSSYYNLLEGLMSMAGLERSDYLLPGQLCYGHSVENWNGTYRGLKMKLDKFTDPSFKDKKKGNGDWEYRPEGEWSFFEEEDNFNKITPGIFKV